MRKFISFGLGIVIAAFSLTGFSRADNLKSVRIQKQEQSVTTLNKTIQADALKTISANEMVKPVGFNSVAGKLSSLVRPVAKAGEEGTETSTDPVFAITNPAKDTVYSETNTPTFEFSLTNAGDVEFGQGDGKALLSLAIYKLDAGSDASPIISTLCFSDTYTVPALPKGSYFIQAVLAKNDGGSLVFWKTEAGANIYGIAVFAINYGDVAPIEDPVLTVLEPAQDTVFEETAFPLFKLDLDPKGQDVELALKIGGAAIMYTIFDEEDNVVDDGYAFDLEFTPSAPLEKGHYFAQFVLAQIASGYKLGYWPYTGRSPVFDYVEFTVNYEQPDPVLTVKNPAKDTTYTETRTPTFELELAHGEGVEFATQPGYAVILYTVYSRDSLEKYPEDPDTAVVFSNYTVGLTASLTTPLPKGDYQVEFVLAQITQEYGFAYWPYKGAEPIYVQANFTIDYAEPDPEFSMKNPARDTVYAETNTPSFEVSVANGEKLVWGEEAGNNAMMVQIYTEEAYNDPKGSPGVQEFVANTAFTVTRALPQGSYHGVFTLMTVSAQAGYFNYVNNLAGERITTEVAFTIAYGTTQDTMLVMKNPAKDTVYSETNTPTFEVSVINGENLDWGTTLGKNVVMMQVYTEEGYNAGANPLIQEFVADTVFAISQPMAKGNYRATFNLMSVSEKAGSYYYVYNAAGRVQANVNFTIDYGDVRNPVLTLIDPAKDTVYTETTTPTFTLSLDKAGNDMELSDGVGNAAIMIEIYKPGATKPMLQDFFVDTFYTVANAEALDTGNYEVKFTLMQWASATQLGYWPATERVTAEVNIRVASLEKPEKMITPTGLSARTHQDTVWFSWISKEEVYQLYITDAAGEVVKNVAVDANTEDTVTMARFTGFAEGTYRWELRAVVVDNAGNVIDYSDWTKARSFTVKYETPSSVEETLLAEVKVYPNPTTGEFMVNVPVDAMVEVYAANGRRIEARTVVAGTETFALKTSGLYFVRVTANGNAAVRRIVVR